MAEEEQQPTAEAIKQRRKREKEAARNVAFGIEKFTIEVAGVFKRDLKKVMKAHGINNQQDVHQRLLINLIGADLEAQATMLRCVTTPIVVSEKVSRLLRAAGMKSLAEDPPEPDDEIERPARSHSPHPVTDGRR
ncbi:hypothetical protein ABCR88_11145 [Pseudomonas sp. W17]|uniref:Uncharacterized protein n=1 Tax=Pseudomonas sp. W17 TaxID=3144407 RepID=A0AAU7X1A8_9PSED